MTIVLLVEGATERALKNKLKDFLDERAPVENKPRVRLLTKQVMTQDRTPEKFQRRVHLELQGKDVKAVVALIDVYPDFQNAAEAKNDLRKAAANESRFYAHAAQYDVEAWLLPYWDAICARIGVHKARPGANPEQVNRQKPPSKRLKELYKLAKHPRRAYVKQIEMEAILRDKDLTVAAAQCGELKSFLNSLLSLSDLTPL